MNWIKRTRQWVAVVRSHKQKVPWMAMARAILSGPVPRKVWMQRMRHGCFKCPIFDRSNYTCHCPRPGFEHLGCKCYVVFQALTAAPYPTGCWGQQVMGPSLGWPAYHFVSRHQKRRAIFGFIFPFFK